MTDHHHKPHHTDQAEHDAALRDFLRGYFHQDLTDEYGTPANAAARFCAEAAPAESAAARNAWERARTHYAGNLSGLNAHLADLGSAWLFGDESELEAVSAAFNHALSHSSGTA